MEFDSTMKSLHSIIVNESSDDDEVFPLVDMMAGLMLVFMMIAILFTSTEDEIVRITPQAEADLIKNKAMKVNRDLEKYKTAQIQISKEINFWKNNRNFIYNKLNDEFEEDLNNWNAEIKKDDLSIIFRGPKIYFDVNDENIQAEFRDILQIFFPRFLRTLREFEDQVIEVRIEGHTSSEWHNRTGIDAYIENMILSQKRSGSVFKYNLRLDGLDENLIRFAKDKIVTAGMSSSKAVKISGSEDPDLSRRVKFRILTDDMKALEALYKVLQGLEY